MENDKNHEKKSFWYTIPGILTGIAALITAGSGLLIVLNQIGVIGSNPSQPYLINNTLPKTKETVSHLPSESTSKPDTFPSSIKYGKVNPTILIDIIREKQKQYVKESYGEKADQCFSDNDLIKFKKSNIIQRINDELKTDKRFIEAVLALKMMTSDEQQKLIKSAMTTYKPTWAEINEINIKGQTDAGQEAEKLIAEAVVDLTKYFLNKSTQELESLVTTY